MIERFLWLYPGTTACFVDDLEAFLAHLKLPPRHRINLRTTDLIERSFVEERRRTKVLPRFTDERSVMKLNSRRSSEHRSGGAACRSTTSNASS